MSDEDFFRRAGCDVRRAASIAENLTIARSGWPQIVIGGMSIGSPEDVDEEGEFHGRQQTGFRRAHLETIAALRGSPLANPFEPPVTAFVDDEATIARVVDVILQLSGVAGSAFASHSELLEACGSRRFDTVVVHTWAETGWMDAAAALRALPGYEGVRVGLSTGMSIDAAMEDALRTGVLDFVIEKPFDRATLLAAVRGEDHPHVATRREQPAIGST